MEPLTLSLLVVFVIISVVPLFSNRTGLPVIVTEIIIGMMLGKSLFNIIPEHPIIDFFSSFGLVYLMFLAGVEVNLSKVKRFFSKTVSIAILSISIPFVTGYFLAEYVGVDPFFFGAIFSTTSLGVILPLSRELKHNPNLSHVLLGSVVLADIISMFILAFSLSLIEGDLGLSFIYSIIIILVLFLIPWLINKSNLYVGIRRWETKKSHFELEVRISFALILIFAAISEELGFHSIIGAFIAGLVISEFTSRASLLEQKLEGFGYGFFIPLFFIFMGAKVDMPSLFSNIGNIQLLFAILFFGMMSKISGVALISRAKGFDLRESISMGLFHSARLSLVIAAVEIGRTMNILDENLFSIFIILAAFSAIVGPSVGKRILLKK